MSLLKFSSQTTPGVNPSSGTVDLFIDSADNLLTVSSLQISVT